MFSALVQRLTTPREAVLPHHYSSSPEIKSSNYRTHKRRASSFTVTMNANVQEIPSAKEGSRDTGFPEPLSPHRNTTLPHPDADTSKNATIEAPDVDLARTPSRRSFLHGRHHSHKLSKGSTINVNESKDSGVGLYDNIQYADGTKEKKSTEQIERDVEKRGDLVDAPSSEDGTMDGAKEDRDEQGYKQGERKKGVLRKLHLHKV